MYCIYGFAPTSTFSVTTEDYVTAIKWIWENYFEWKGIKNTISEDGIIPILGLYDIDTNEFLGEFKYNEEKKGYRPIEPIEWE